jgi:hypothetical protein
MRTAQMITFVRVLQGTGDRRRYSLPLLADSDEDVHELMKHTGWKLEDRAGSTYPVSIFCSLYQTSWYVGQKIRNCTYSPLERTKQSGKREVQFKTHFPFLLGLSLKSSRIMATMASIQKCFKRSPNAFGDTI